MNKKILQYIETKGKNNLTLALRGFVDGGLAKGLKNFSIREDLDNDRLLLNLVELETRKSEKGYELVKPILTMIRLYNDRIEYLCVETKLYEERMPIKYFANEEQDEYKVIKTDSFDDIGKLIEKVRQLIDNNSRPNKQATYYPYSIDMRRKTETKKVIFVIASVFIIMSVYSYYLKDITGLAVGLGVASILSFAVWYFMVKHPYVRYKKMKIKEKTDEV